MAAQYHAVLFACTTYGAEVKFQYLFDELPTEGTTMYLDLPDHPLLFPLEHHADHTTGHDEIKVIAEVMLIGSSTTIDPQTFEIMEVPVVMCSLSPAAGNTFPIGEN